MTATPRFVSELREKARMRIDQDLEALILKRFATEPYPYTYTEQDLREQTSKVVTGYNEEHKDRRLDELPFRRAEPKGGSL